MRAWIPHKRKKYPEALGGKTNQSCNGFVLLLTKPKHAEVWCDGLSSSPSLLVVPAGDGAPGSLEQCGELPAFVAKTFAVRKRVNVHREQNKH